MSFWIDLKKSGQEAAERAKDLAEVTRLQLAQKEQERKLEKLYGQLGRACYDAAVPGEESPFSELIGAIAQTLEEIEQSKEQQRLLKGGVRCAVCGALMDADALFCTSCGAEKTVAQPEPEPAAEPGKIICPVCGKQVNPKAFCSFCGAKLS